jgi:hypothetical protein
MISGDHSPAAGEDRLDVPPCEIAVERGVTVGCEHLRRVYTRAHDKESPIGREEKAQLDWQCICKRRKGTWSEQYLYPQAAWGWRAVHRHSGYCRMLRISDLIFQSN